jgi:DNA-binding HxlR family transcriptional regulator
LEKDGLLTRTVFGKKPPVKVLYQLTAFGKSFSPVLKAITDWGNQVATQRGEFVSQID